MEAVKPPVAGTKRMASAFADAARDTRFIRGVHHYCDEWCDMCPVSGRCLAFRCMAIYRREKGRRQGETTFRTPGEVVEFTRHLAAAEGVCTPGLDAALAEAAQPVGFRSLEPLAKVAWQYALAVSMWLVLTPDDLRRMRTGPGPSPEEIVLWYHLRIYIKLVRATAAQESPASRSHDEDADGFAKLTLVCIQRSRKALLQMKKRPNGAEAVPPLLAMLDTLEREIDRRFPNARAFVRFGLDGV